mmetsp:Transcript_33208/g.61143  ORF Transcript_33208/g.61143 Transcript_33208/m.61143 type:complete len:472 (-) Transcript_33208:185-1600(-)
MNRSNNRFVATLFILLSGEISGLVSTDVGIRQPFFSPTKSTGVTSNQFRVNNNDKLGFIRHNRRSKTCLTSTYVGVRDMSKSFPWQPSFIQKPARWASKLTRRKCSKRLLCSIILACIVMFAPAFSPAARAASVSATTTTVAAMPVATNRLSPVAMPFSTQSRALGTFNIIPTKAEMELCFRLLYAACSGAFVGIERSSSDRPAGIRTMALVGLGACIYTICSTHGFLPHSALGYAPGSPYLSEVKVDLSRMAASIASGVGFIGAGAIHKSKLHGGGTESQNVVAGLTTAAAIWVSAAVGIASAVGLYFVGAVATFSTVAILKYARVPKEEDGKEGPGFPWQPRPLDVVDHPHGHRQSSRQEYSPTKHDAIYGLFGKNQFVDGYDPHVNAFVNQGIMESDSKDIHPVILKEVLDRRFEQYLESRLGTEKEGERAHDEKELHRVSKVLIEEEQEIVSHNGTTEREQDSSVEP